MEKIPFISLGLSKDTDELQRILTKIEDVARTGNFVLGKPVEEFEAAFADLTGCRYGIGVNSGLDALVLSLKALGIGSGDQVITAPNSFLASAGAIALVGATPVFVDVTDDFNLDVHQLEEAINSRTRAIIPVHLAGYPCDMGPLMTLAARKKLKVIEDAAQSVGSVYQNQPVGSFGDAGCFSLHPLKNLHAWGDGGIVVTRSKELMEDLRTRRNHGLVNRDEAAYFSYNSRLDTIQAVVTMEFLRSLPQTIEKRQKNANIYFERLSGLGEYVRLPIVAPDRTHTFHVFQVRASRREELKSYLENNGVETKVHYPIPIHLQPAAKYLGYEKGDFPVTERLATEILSLPVRESLGEKEVHRVCDLLGCFYKASHSI